MQVGAGMRLHYEVRFIDATGRCVRREFTAYTTATRFISNLLTDGFEATIRPLPRDDE